MKLHPLAVDGAFVLELDQSTDHRGHFLRLFSQVEFLVCRLETKIAQINNSVSERAGTLRGLHFQEAPFDEVKVLRCLKGRLFDVIADARPQSPTFGRWQGVELDESRATLVYVPAGCAHGFMALTDGAEVIYTSSAPWSSAHEQVVRWNDPFFNILWPMPPTLLSDKDANAPDFRATDG